jgi:hypothetical protein
LAPADSFINKYVRDTTDIGGIAKLYAVDRVRITGTFSYIGGLSALLNFYGFLIWGMRLTKVSALYIVIIIVSCVVIAPMTGSRGTSATLIILAACALISTVGNIRNSVAIVALFAVLYVVAQYTDLSLVGEAYTGLSERVTTHIDDGESQTRIVGQIEEILSFKGNYPFFGTGLGGTYQGSTGFFGESIYLKEYGYYEEEPERIILEGGFLLFFVRIILWLLLIRLSAIPTGFGLVILILNLFYSNTTYNVFIIFFTFFGIMYLDRCYYLRNQALIK